MSPVKSSKVRPRLQRGTPYSLATRNFGTHRQALYVEPELRGFFVGLFSDAPLRGRFVNAFDDSVALLGQLGNTLGDDHLERPVLEAGDMEQLKAGDDNQDADEESEDGINSNESVLSIQTLTDAGGLFSLRDVQRVKAQRILENQRRFSAKILRRSSETELVPRSSGQVWRRGCDDMLWSDLQVSVAPEFDPKVEYYDNYQVKWSVSVFVADDGSDLVEYYGEYLVADYGCAELSMHLVFVDYEEHPEGLRPV